MALPLLVGFILGPDALGGFLGGSIFTGVIFALLMANAGGLWDNAKKFIETGQLVVPVPTRTRPALSATPWAILSRTPPARRSTR